MCRKIYVSSNFLNIFVRLLTSFLFLVFLRFGLMTGINPASRMIRALSVLSNPESSVSGILVRGMCNCFSVLCSFSNEYGNRTESCVFNEAVTQGTMTLPELSLISTDFSPR